MQCGDCCSIKDSSIKKRIPVYPEEVDHLIKIAKKRNLDFRVMEDLIFPDVLNKKILVITYKIILINQNNRCPFYENKLGCTIHKQKPLACQSYPLALKQIDAFNFQISIDPLCNFVKKKYDFLENLDLSELKLVFKEEYEKAKKHLNKNKRIIIKIRELEHFNKIKIGRQIKLKNFNKYLREWDREDFYVK